MNSARFFFLQDDEVIYHYCTPQAFLLICTNKTIRFSDIYTMNDSMEMQWGYKLWEDFAAATGQDNARWSSLKFVVSQYLEILVPLASCYSTQGDILSQWRAYADDGSGFCIGFNRKFSRALPASVMRVEYGLERQKLEIAELTKVALSLDEGTKEFDDAAMELATNLFGYKNPAFVEESEVRMFHGAAKDAESNVIRSLGGHAMGSNVPPAEMQFQMRSSTPSPYVDLSFFGVANPISEVILGPKNYAEPDRIVQFLATQGFADVQVRRSTASYR